MEETFAKNFESACFDSMGILARQKMDKREQDEYDQEVEVARNKLLQALRGEAGLLIDYDNAVYFASGNDRIFIYQQGFQDCVYLLRWMGVIQ